MQTSFETVDVELTDGIGSLTLDRPASLNAMNGAMRAEIERGLDWLEASEAEDELVRVVTIEGAVWSWRWRVISGSRASRVNSAFRRSISVSFPVRVGCSTSHGLPAHRWRKSLR